MKENIAAHSCVTVYTTSRHAILTSLSVNSIKSNLLQRKQTSSLLFSIRLMTWIQNKLLRSTIYNATREFTYLPITCFICILIVVSFPSHMCKANNKKCLNIPNKVSLLSIFNCTYHFTCCKYEFAFYITNW